MSLIDSTYFTGEIAVPQASSDTNLTAAITQYEKEILKMLLGDKLYWLFVADCTGEGGIPVTEKYLDLVNGKEFTLEYEGHDYTLKWEGLKNAAKQSLIAYYTFYKFVERDVTRLYGTGISAAKPNSDGWERVSPVNKLCNTWERMRELYGKIPPEYYKYYRSGPIIGEDLSAPFNADPSALNFLYANKSDYPDWVFTPLWNLNAFGI